MRTPFAHSLLPLLVACFYVGCGTAATNTTEPDGGATANVDAGATSPSDDSGFSVDDAGVCVGGGCVDAGVISDPGELGDETATTKSSSVTVGDSAISLTIHMPDTAGARPVIIFTHGFQLGATNYASYGQHLASWGYIVVMPDFPGGLLNAPNHRVLKGMLIGVIDWVVANATIPSGPLDGKADTAAIALAGHSMGGKISLLVSAHDSRPVAVFGVDPVDAAGGPFGGDPVDYPSVTPELMPQISVPIVLLGETVNATGGLGGACAPADNNFQQYYDHAASKALQIETVGANHMSFLDDPNCGLTCSACPAGTDDSATTRRLTRRYMTAFFNVFVMLRQQYRSYLTGAAMDEDVAAGLVLTESKNGF